MEERDNTIKSAKKIFHVLEILTNMSSASISDLSRITGFTMSTTQRIVNTLTEMKYVRQDPNTLKYSVSYKLFSLAQRFEYKDTLIETAKPFLKSLATNLKETINLGVMENHELIYIDKIVSKEPLRIELNIGSEAPFYCTGLGKAIAAFKDEDISVANYKKFTKNTITSDEELKDSFKNIREVGYAVDDEEFMDGLYCIAMPILNKDKEAIAAISVSYPKMRKSDLKNETIITSLKEATNSISELLF